MISFGWLAWKRTCLFCIRQEFEPNAYSAFPWDKAARPRPAARFSLVILYVMLAAGYYVSRLSQCHSPIQL